MIRRRRIGILLRQYRDAAGLTTAQVGKELECSGAKISRVETANSPAQRRDVRDMLDLYDVTDEQREEVMDLLKDSKHPGWWDQYTDVLPKKYSTFIGFEADAAVCRTYEPLVVPGLLQTEDYARATIRKTLPDATLEDINARVEVRIARQKVLTKENPLRLVVVIDESALRRQIGRPQIMRDQRQRLVEASEMPNVRIQVHPFDHGPLACTTGPFVLIEFRRTRRSPDRLHRERCWWTSIWRSHARSRAISSCSMSSAPTRSEQTTPQSSSGGSTTRHERSAG